MRRKGFTLIELLVVIAIIAILAAILFPVFGNVRKKVRETQCMTQMHDVYIALKVYKEDNNKYPAALFGFAEDTSGNLYTSGTAANISNLRYKPLFTKQNYLKDNTKYQCPVTKDKSQTDVTTAVYPALIAAPSNSALAGTNVVYYGAIQHNIGYEGPEYTGSTPPVYPGYGQRIYFYKYDNYDIQPKPNTNLDGPDTSNLYEIHYALNWSIKPAAPPNDSNVTSASDFRAFPNQMKYGNRADESHTVVTWCNEHALLAGSDKYLVLSLSGQVKPVDKKTFTQKGPLTILK